MIIYSLISVFLLSFSLVAGFIIGKPFFNNKNVHLTSGYVFFLAILMVLYFLSILAFNILSFNTKFFWCGLILLVFIAIPFIIGKIASYEKLNLYTNMQISAFYASFILSYLFLIFIKGQ